MSWVLSQNQGRCDEAQKAAKWMRQSMKVQEQNDQHTVFLLNLLQEHRHEIEARDSVMRDSTVLVCKLQAEVESLKQQLGDRDTQLLAFKEFSNASARSPSGGAIAGFRVTDASSSGDGGIAGWRQRPGAKDRDCQIVGGWHTGGNPRSAQLSTCSTLQEAWARMRVAPDAATLQSPGRLNSDCPEVPLPPATPPPRSHVPGPLPGPSAVPRKPHELILQAEDTGACTMQIPQQHTGQGQAHELQQQRRLEAQVRALTADMSSLQAEAEAAKRDAAEAKSNYLTCHKDLEILTSKYDSLMLQKLEVEEQRDRLFSPQLDVKLIRAAMPSVDAALATLERRLVAAAEMLAVCQAEAEDAARVQNQQRRKWILRLESMQAQVEEREARLARVEAQLGGAMSALTPQAVQRSVGAAVPDTDCSPVVSDAGCGMDFESVAVSPGRQPLVDVRAWARGVLPTRCWEDELQANLSIGGSVASFDTATSAFLRATSGGGEEGGSNGHGRRTLAGALSSP